jgi:amino acid permease
MALFARTPMTLLSNLAGV